MSCAKSSRRRSRCYHAGSDLAVGLVGLNWLDAAAWIAAAWAFIEGHFTLKMEMRAMLHVKTCVGIAAALWRSGRLLIHVGSGADADRPVGQADRYA